MAKYPIKQSLKNLSEIIAKQVSRYFFCYFELVPMSLEDFHGVIFISQVGQIETDLKNKATAYNSLKSSLQSIGTVIPRFQLQISDRPVNNNVAQNI